MVGYLGSPWMKQNCPDAPIIKIMIFSYFNMSPIMIIFFKKLLEAPLGPQLFISQMDPRTLNKCHFTPIWRLQWVLWFLLALMSFFGRFCKGKYIFRTQIHMFYSKLVLGHVVLPFYSQINQLSTKKSSIFIWKNKKTKKSWKSPFFSIF